VSADPSPIELPLISVDEWMELVPASNADCSPDAPYSVKLWPIVMPLLEMGAQTKPCSAAE
jgi:hypothetical protein